MGRCGCKCDGWVDAGVGGWVLVWWVDAGVGGWVLVWVGGWMQVWVGGC